MGNSLEGSYLTAWFSGNVKPKREGYYIVTHPKGRWITGDEVLARFQDGKWERPVGWAAPSKGHAFCADCAIRDGHVFDPGCHLYERVEPTQWRGKARP